MTESSPTTLSSRLRALAAAATPGEWEWQTGSSWTRLGTKTGRRTDGSVICPTNHPTDRHPDLIVSREDRELIVELRNNIDAIVRALDALDGAEIALARIADHTDPHGDVTKEDGSEQCVTLFARAALAQIKDTRP